MEDAIPSPSESKMTVLYVDDEANNLLSFKAAFRRDFEIYIAESAQEGIRILASKHIDIIISDQRMPEMTGVEFLEFVKDRYPEPMRMLLTGYADLAAVIDAINRGQVYRYLTKPWDEHDLRLTMLQAYEVYCLRAENKALIQDLTEANRELEYLLRKKLIS